MTMIFNELTKDQYDVVADVDDIFPGARDLFINPSGMPDGGATYGILFNSKAPAIGGFGVSPNTEPEDGQDLTINNVEIRGLRLEANEIPVVYFDKCDNPQSRAHSIQKGPFGDVFDLSRAISTFDAALIEEHSTNSDSLYDIQYVGNVLADAQIALSVFCGITSKSFCFGTNIDSRLSDWAQDSVANPFPSQCADFVCNGDIMFHTNKGIMGARIDGIENTQIIDLKISDLINSSPLVSFACGSYEGPHDGGAPGQEMEEGGMGTDVRGLIISRGDVEIIGAENMIYGLNSFYGDIVGVDIINEAVVDFDVGSDIYVNHLISASRLTDADYQTLVAEGKTPYPNNFNMCSVEVENGTSLIGHFPEDLSETDCVDGKNTQCVDLGFEQVYGMLLEEVSVASDGTVYGTSKGDKIYRYDSGSWTYIGGRLEQIDVGSANLIYGVNDRDYIYRYHGGGWTKIYGKLKHISVAADGTVWGIDKYGGIYRRDGTSWTRVHGQLAQIDVGSATNVWGVGVYGHIFKSNNNGGWIHVPGSLSHVSVGEDGTVLGVNRNDEIYLYDGGVLNWKRVCGELKYIEVGSKIHIWGVDEQGVVYKATKV